MNQPQLVIFLCTLFAQRSVTVMNMTLSVRYVSKCFEFCISQALKKIHEKLIFFLESTRNNDITRCACEFWVSHSNGLTLLVFIFHNFFISLFRLFRILSIETNAQGCNKTLEAGPDWKWRPRWSHRGRRQTMKTCTFKVRDPELLSKSAWIFLRDFTYFQRQNYVLIWARARPEKRRLYERRQVKIRYPINTASAMHKFGIGNGPVVQIQIHLGTIHTIKIKVNPK